MLLKYSLNWFYIFISKVLQIKNKTFNYLFGLNPNIALCELKSSLSLFIKNRNLFTFHFYEFVWLKQLPNELESFLLNVSFTKCFFENQKSTKPLLVEYKKKGFPGPPAPPPLNLFSPPPKSIERDTLKEKFEKFVN